MPFAAITTDIIQTHVAVVAFCPLQMVQYHIIALIVVTKQAILQEEHSASNIVNY
jgi:hypothetical protein